MKAGFVGVQTIGELILVRHAPVARAGFLYGRTDVDAAVDPVAASFVKSALPAAPGMIVTSGAQRCVQTAEAIWPNATFEDDARLWEQDFGADEGRAYGELPDLGPLSNEVLSHHKSPGGESFQDLCQRVWPALGALAARASPVQDPVALVVHAGTIRAALALALGDVALGLSFEIDNLSVTRIRTHEDRLISIRSVNRT